MSTIVSHSPLNISETIRDRGFKAPPTWKSTRNQMVTWPITSR